VSISQKTKMLIVIAALMLVAVVLGGFGLVAQSQTTQAPATTPQAGMTHLYVDGVFVANVLPTETQKLSASSFVDKEQGKTQCGYRQGAVPWRTRSSMPTGAWSGPTTVSSPISP
jgi:hypothetical protein